MSKKKLQVYRVEDIKEKGEEIKKHNAFIRRDGTFYLAKGYTGCNPSHQLDSSALQVGRQDIGLDFIEKYKESYQNIEPSLITYTEEEKLELFKEYVHFKVLEDRWLQLKEGRLKDDTQISINVYEYYLESDIKFRQERVMQKRELQRIRSILIHYYGYALFARKEDVDSELGRGKVFYDESIIPNPEYYGQSATEEQLETLEELYTLDRSKNYIKKRLFYIKNHLGTLSWHC